MCASITAANDAPSTLRHDRVGIAGSELCQAGPEIAVWVRGAAVREIYFIKGATCWSN